MKYLAIVLNKRKRIRIRMKLNPKMGRCTGWCYEEGRTSVQNTDIDLMKLTYAWQLRCAPRSRDF